MKRRIDVVARLRCPHCKHEWDSRVARPQRCPGCTIQYRYHEGEGRRVPSVVTEL